MAVVATMFVSTILAAEQEKDVEARLFELLEKMVVKKEQEERDLAERSLIQAFTESLRTLSGMEVRALDASVRVCYKACEAAHVGMAKLSAKLQCNSDCLKPHYTIPTTVRGGSMG